jgi:hypothetical protein
MLLSKICSIAILHAKKYDNAKIKNNCGDGHSFGFYHESVKISGDST